MQDLPFFLILGLLAGVSGAVFNRGIFASLGGYRRLKFLSLSWRVGLAGLISGLVAVLLPLSFRDNAGLREFLITGDLGWQLTLIAFFSKFVLTLIAYGSGASGGIFAPAMIIGSALGSLVGFTALNLQTWVGIPLGVPEGISPTATYALAGMGAFFSAVTRVPITAIVIVFEMTMDFNLVLPLMIGSVIAYLIADKFDPGSIYKRLLAWNGIKLGKEASANGPWAELTADDLMQRRVETLSQHMTLKQAVKTFASSHHRGFPVVDDGKLVGIISQTDLAEAASRGLDSETSLQKIMTPQPVTVTPSDPLTHVLYLLNRYKLSRLPVIEGHKLVGIITRGDIIRAESDQLSGEADYLGPQPEPSYVVYQTRAPATGQARLLIPLSNPQTAPELLRIAAAIAHARHAELECLQVIVVPRSITPAETAVKTTTSRRLLRQAEQIGKKLQVPIHTQIRVAHDAAHAILETIKERHIDLILMGWKQDTIPTPGPVFGNIVDTIIHQAVCDVVLVKLGRSAKFDRWLVPIAGGPNAQQALQLLPALASLGRVPKIKICQVFQPGQVTPPDTDRLQQAEQDLTPRVDGSVEAISVVGTSIPDTVIDLAHQHQCHVILVGASREGLLQQVIKGNIPAAIARGSNCTVILVRSVRNR
ncbi:MAG: CBS domain-containing protein [Cyanothece sp. SIO1E1]|nr:CBS domain-containing protein [Cyanothece sp. SIO1E1]